MAMLYICAERLLLFFGDVVVAIVAVVVNMVSVCSMQRMIYI